MTIVITRPLEDAVEESETLKAEGFDTLIEPMLLIEPKSIDLPDLEQYQAILLTSGNAVRLLALETERRDIPLYTVGRNTAMEAEQRGFKYVLNADGDGDDLVILVQKGIQDKGKPVLHVRGEHQAVPIDEMLIDSGIKVDTVVIYVAHKTTHFSGLFIEALKTGKIDAVSFYSRRTAENFMKLIEAGNYQAHLKSIKALCLSKSILKCVESCEWAEMHAAEEMNRDGMLALMRKTCSQTRPQKKTEEVVEKTARTAQSEDKKVAAKSAAPKPAGKTAKAPADDAIDGAEEIIERFGGIRPMAKKTEVAVTTVQGWKKRDTIPAARRSQVLEAAAAHNIDLSDIVEDALAVSVATDSPPANENADNDAAGQVQDKSGQTRNEKQAPSAPVRAAPSVPRAKRAASALSSEELAAKLAAMEKQAIAKSTWINVVLVLITVAAVALLLRPEPRQSDRRALESRIEVARNDAGETQKKQSFLSTLIPEDLDKRIASMQEKAHEVKEGAVRAKETAGAAVNKAREISEDVLAEDAGTIDERVAKLQLHAGEVLADPKFEGLRARFAMMNESLLGQQRLKETVGDLSALVGGLDGDTSQINEVLDAARQKNANLGQSFEDVPAQDLKAAALLLGMTQFRQSLNRNNEPFADDLTLLKNLVSEDNPELAAALDRLAPRAEEGVLTPGGLSNEFKTIAGDVVVSSLKGEDVSFSEKTKARMSELFQIEKDGELITGTPTQATVSRANTLLEQGDISGAIAEMKMLEGEEAQIAQPWIDEAEATLMAEQLKQFMSGAAGSFNGGLGAIGLGKTELIQNKETGINILKRSGPELPKLPKRSFQ